MITDLAAAIAAYFLTRNFVLESVSYISWIFLSAKTTLVVFIVTAIVNAVVCGQQVKDMLKLLRHK